MTTIITRSYPDYASASSAVAQLENSGIPSDRITLVSHSVPGETYTTTGATAGGTIGGAAGLLAGLGLIAIPGIGPVVAAGWLASTLAGITAGAITGGVFGALSSLGASDEDTHYYAETIRRGGAIVSVKALDSEVNRVETLLDRTNPYDVAQRRAEYQREGWSRFDDKLPPAI